MLTQLLALYIDPDSHNAQRYRQTDRRHDDANTVWNSLPDDLRDPTVNSVQFRRNLKTYLFA